jgi:hypothetical protein
VELDYGGMHARILYHIHSIDFQDDPYALWGKKTTPALRLLAKTCINISLNSKTRENAISQCNLEMSTWTKDKDNERKPIRKQGKALEDALRLYTASKKSGVTFGQIYDLALKHHKPIAKYFGSDAGIWLMRVDSAIAIDVMYEFAKQAIPCLCCHDSFIIPEHHEQELRELMNKWYSLRFRYFPVIK